MKASFNLSQLQFTFAEVMKLIVEVIYALYTPVLH